MASLIVTVSLRVLVADCLVVCRIICALQDISNGSLFVVSSLSTDQLSG